MPPHLVLLGDSIFDNQAYTRGETNVVRHLRNVLPSPRRATLLAVDGATIDGLAAQVARVPGDLPSGRLVPERSGVSGG